MTEGRGPMVNDACFSEEQDAKDYIDSKQGIMGRTAKWSESRAGDWDIVPLNVASSLQEVEEIRDKAIKEKALSKLTPEEKRVLGL